MINDDDDDEELDMEEFMKLTDEEGEAACEREMKKYNDWFASLSRDQQVRYLRHRALKTILENRNRLKNPDLCIIPYVVELWKDGVRRGQRNLLKVRHFRATGIYPGEG